MTTTTTGTTGTTRELELMARGRWLFTAVGGADALSWWRPMRDALALLGLLALAACTRLDVLSAIPCEPLADAGAPCSFLGTCARPSDGGCPSTVYCRDGRVWISTPACGAGDGTDAECVEDPDCGTGALCLDGGCAPCPTAHPCEPPTESLLVELPRNGCRTCQYVPSYDCDHEGACSEGKVCYRGGRCAADCARFDCCANQCAAPGCAEPAPLGCLARCVGAMSCDTCMTSRCACVSGTWQCDLVCASVSSSCLYAP